MTGPTNTRSVSKDWWRDFFNPIIGEVLFAGKAEQSETEVRHIIDRSKVRAPLKVLDLACGVGRHSLAFAARGFEVTGLDYSKPYLQAARRAARNAGRPISFVHGDMKDLKSYLPANHFGLVISLYNSFGYFSRRRDDLKMLKEVYRVLVPGGAFVINTLNAGGVARRLKTPISIGSEPLPNVFMIEASRYNARKKETFANWTIVDARRQKTRVFRQSFRQNIYSHAELRRHLIAAGFRIEATWALLSGRPFNPNKSWSQTILARKPS